MSADAELDARIHEAEEELRALKDRLRRRGEGGRTDTGYFISTPEGPKPVSGEYFTRMRDGVREPPPDPVRRQEKELREERRARPGAIIRPVTEVSPDTVVIVHVHGTYHRKAGRSQSKCIKLMFKDGKRPGIVWWGPISKVEEALSRIARGEDLRPCKTCVDVDAAYKFKYARPKKPKDDYADIEWVDDVLSDKEAEQIIRRAKDIDVDEE